MPETRARNFRLVLEYDGSNYHGWQRQKGVLTIQEVVETRLAVMTQRPVRLIGAGRTDAGVHARGQVANFFTQTRIPADGLLQGLNSLLPEDIVARELAEAPEKFHARFQARSKLYEYRIHNGPIAPALGRQYCWHIRQPLRWQDIEKCLRLLEGEHDFASFQAAGSKVRNTVRVIFSADLEPVAPELWAIKVEANGFLRHMMRNMVGTLVEVGRGRVTVEEFSSIMAARDRMLAGMTAPARGLCLELVRY